MQVHLIRFQGNHMGLGLKLKLSWFGLCSGQRYHNLVRWLAFKMYLSHIRSSQKGRYVP